MTKQRGSIREMLLFIVVVVLAGCFAYDYSAASVDAVKEVIVLAEENPKAATTVKAFFASNSKPSNRELRGLKEQVNEILVVQLAKTASGSEPKSKAPEMTFEQFVDQAIPGGRTVFWVITAFVFLVCSMVFITALLTGFSDAKRGR